VENFKDGKFDGEYICYYKDGQIKEKGSFINDKRNGTYIAFYKNGQVREQATYIHGKLEGEFLSFDADDPRYQGDDDKDDSCPFTDEIDVKDTGKRIDDLLKNIASFEKELKEK
jgi:hypothetical protein